MTRRLSLGGMFIALGILIPLLFHSLGLGPFFLPMFWPVAMSGFFLSPLMAMAAGLLTPLLSTALTGMPPVPILYKMIIELALLGSITALVRRRRGGSMHLSLAVGLLAAFAGGTAGAALLAPLLGLPRSLYALGSLLTSLPAAVIMLLLIPVLVQKIPVPHSGEISRRHDADTP